MKITKNNIFTVILSIQFVVVLVFYNIYAFNLADNFLIEKTDGRRMKIDLICDVAESGANPDTLISAIQEIDSAGKHGTYAAVFDTNLQIITERTPYFELMNFNPFDNSEFARDTRINNRGSLSMIVKPPDESPHVIHMYFRWIYRDTDEPLLVVLGVSKYAVETDIDGGLMIGAYLIAASFGVTGFASIFIAIRRKRGDKK
jgi:hypothetical protein